jgi:putative sterol carrier protein
MPRIGSEEWVAELDAALRALPSGGEGDAPAGAADLIVQQELSDTGAAWHVVVAGGEASARSGRHPDPDVTLTQETATAAAINAGTLSAQTAFIDGRLRISGAVDRLREATDVLGALTPVPAAAET